MSNRISAIDGMKGCAAICIACIYHLATVPFSYQNGLPLQNNIIVSWIYTYGYIFVECFFMISGYLAFSNYTNKIERQDISLVEFILGRIIRIFPLMIITLITAGLSEMIFFMTHNKCFWWGGGETILF